MSPNEFLPSEWVERVHRLALSLEARDPMRRSRIGIPVEAALDGVPHPPALTRRDRSLGPWEPQDVLPRLARHGSGRHVLLLRPGVGSQVDVRLLDRSQRFVPRRLRIHLPVPVGRGRVCRPALFAGAAYDVPAGAVGVRGRVLRGGRPMRWARVEARRTEDGRVVGRAHGDHRGEFLLLLESEAVLGVDLTLPVRVRVTVFGPDVQPDPVAVPDSDVDPLWDLPLEVVALAPVGDQALSGEALPAGYVSRPNSTRVVELGLHRLGSEEFDFS